MKQVLENMTVQKEDKTAISQASEVWGSFLTGLSSWGI
jgi:hypothetical protein